jgi:polysaccharide biosynthesis transport protein
VAGAVVGTGAHFVLRSTSPVYTSSVLFECSQPGNDVTEPFSSTLSAEEMNRFMQTQVRIMTSDEIMRKVASDPALVNAAPDWCAKYTVNGIVDDVKAVKDLKDDVGARVIAGTNLIELSMRWRDKYNTTAVVGAVRTKYLNQVNEAVRIQMEDRTAAVRARLADLDREAANLGTQKETLIQSKSVDSIDSRIESTRAELGEVQGRLIDLQQAIEGRGTLLRQMEAEIQNPGGIAFGDELKDEVERNPTILDLKRDLQNAETGLQSLVEGGMTREHRQYIAVEGNIRAIRQNLETKRSEELQKAFSARLDTTRKGLDTLRAQEKSLAQRRDELVARQTDLTRVQSQINDIENKLQGVIRARSDLNADLQKLLANAQVGTASRVRLLQAERAPNELTFPRLKMMLPGGAVLFLAITAGIVLLRELVDQRVKSPSDIQIIPRAKLVGWVPDAAEDPAGQGAVETAFRDRPRGVVAESFRQVRATVAKRLNQSDHRTLLVMSGMPSSGATSVAANLALAFASADKRVLLVDANFRRPALHRVFGLQESPGLADVMSRSAEIGQVVQASSTPNLDVLTAGSKEQRVFERLAGDGMGEILARLRAMYDLVIIDVAPAVVGGDALAIAQRCDASMLVVRAMADKRGMVARIRNDIAETKGEFLGMLVNGVKSASGGYMKRNIQTAHEYQNS